MKTAYFDLIAGASGDMILGALINAGLYPVISERGITQILQALLTKAKRAVEVAIEEGEEKALQMFQSV